MEELVANDTNLRQASLPVQRLKTECGHIMLYHQWQRWAFRVLKIWIPRTVIAIDYDIERSCETQSSAPAQEWILGRFWRTCVTLHEFHLRDGGTANKLILVDFLQRSAKCLNPILAHCIMAIQSESRPKIVRTHVTTKNAWHAVQPHRANMCTSVGKTWQN